MSKFDLAIAGPDQRLYGTQYFAGAQRSFYVVEPVDQSCGLMYPWNIEMGYENHLQFVRNTSISTAEVPTQPVLSAFPIPCTDRLHVRCSIAPAPLLWQVTDASGKHLLHGQAAGDFDINTTSLPPGVYVLLMKDVNSKKPFKQLVFVKI